MNRNELTSRWRPTFSLRWAAPAVVAALATLAVAPAASAQEFDLSWNTVDGGGGVSSGGDFELAATIAQPDAGVMSGGSFELAGGFWPGVQAGGGQRCTGDERINKARCKVKRGAGRLTIKLSGGRPDDAYTIELSSGETDEGTLNRKGKAKSKFTGLAPGEGTATVTFGCGAELQRDYNCQ